MKDEHPGDKPKEGFLASLRKKFSPNESGCTGDDDNEIKRAVCEGSQKGIIEDNEAEIINNVIEFAEKQAKDIMINRAGICALDATSTVEEAFKKTMEEGYSRYPVYIDNIDRIIGVFHIRDLVRAYASEEMRNKELLDLRGTVLFDAYVIPETRSISRLLRDMQKKKIHMAIVADEYGQISGLVTMEDIMEEIFGNIFDEHDKAEPEIVIMTDGSYMMSGITPLEDAAEILKIEFPFEEFETINGLMTYKLGHIPNEGEEFTLIFEGYRFKIIEVNDKVITKVHVTKMK